MQYILHGQKDFTNNGEGSDSAAQAWVKLTVWQPRTVVSYEIIRTYSLETKLLLQLQTS
jgi:hypothetical protein